MNCVVCTDKIGVQELQQPIYIDGDVKEAHFKCGMEILSSTVTVYKVTFEGASYFDQSLESVMDMIKDSDVGHSFKVEKQFMDHQKYHSLKEFEGF